MRMHTQRYSNLGSSLPFILCAYGISSNCLLSVFLNDRSPDFCMLFACYHMKRYDSLKSKTVQEVDVHCQVEHQRLSHVPKEVSVADFLSTFQNFDWNMTVL